MNRYAKSVKMLITLQSSNQRYEKFQKAQNYFHFVEWSNVCVCVCVYIDGCDSFTVFVNSF